MDIERKTEKAREIIAGQGSVIVAFSGGADSTLVAKLALDECGANALLATLVSETFTEREKERARKLAEMMGGRSEIIKTRELDNPVFRANDKDRCYHCKLHRLAQIEKRRRSLGYNAVVDGSNADDAADYRPGARAAEELGVISPLALAGFTKNDVREASRALNLPTWDAPSDACLASRIPYGTEITADLLKTIEKAEAAVRDITGCDIVRVRHHGDVARIELASQCVEAAAVEKKRKSIFRALKGLGYLHVALDLEGYETGSMNRGIIK